MGAQPTGGTETIRSMPAAYPPTALRGRHRFGRHILYLHGGGFVAGSPALYRDFTWRIANVTRARVLCIAYRLAPEHPFPGRA